MNSRLDGRRPVWSLEYVAKESFARPLLPSVQLHGGGAGSDGGGTRSGGGESLFARAAREQAAEQARELRGGARSGASTTVRREAQREADRCVGGGPRRKTATHKSHTVAYSHA